MPKDADERLGGALGVSIQQALEARNNAYRGSNQTASAFTDLRVPRLLVQIDDVIARGSYPVDIHNPEGKGTILKRIPPDEAYDIPLRSLLPKGVEHLVVAGRCISGTHEAHSSYRVMPISMATGQAAGVCAALAARRDEPPREVPPPRCRTSYNARAPT